MNIYFKAAAFLVFALVSAAPARAGETIAGKWKGQFDSQIGIQKYTFDFKVDGTNVTGTAIGEREMGTNEVKIAEGKVTGEEVSFVEPLKFEDNELRIEYTGKIKGDEIKFHRKVGDFAEEDFVARRIKDTDVKSDSSSGSKTESNPATNAAPAKPQ